MKNQFLLFFFSCLSILTINAAGGNKLLNSTMESKGAWQVSYLNTPLTQLPVATWGYTTQKPASGAGGGLHATGTAKVSSTHLCIYQEVTLSADSVYNVDGAFKHIQLNRSWCEIFIGKIPVAAEDYTESLGVKVAGFGAWDNPATIADGTFKLNAALYKQFQPATSGTYYFVLKMGATTWDAETPTFEIIVDELKLTSERVAPVAAFKSDVRTGFAPLKVQFTDESSFATSWAWTFGDGGTSTEKKPAYTYKTAGEYTVQLTATNEKGSTIKKEDRYIKVTALAPLMGGGILKGGNMENASSWQIDFLNTSAAQNNPVAVWNEQLKKPTAGQGGALHVTAPAGQQGIQFAIYQKVRLSSDSVYFFDGAFRDYSSNLKNFWTEVFIGTKPAGGGKDYGNDEGKMIAKFDAWNAGSPVAGLDGTFKIHANVNNTFTPVTSGEYYFVLKMGTWDGIGFSVAIDELSLTRVRTKPNVKFSATNTVGFPTLTVKFVNESRFATAYEWDFGDGSAKSTLPDPTHAYAVVGTFNVKLKATNEKGDTTLVKNEFVKVNTKPALPPGELLYGGNMENGNFWATNKCNPADVSTFTWNYTGAKPTGGVGGNLRIQTTGAGFNTAIFQEVKLKAGFTYVFDGLFKDVKGVAEFWCEGFIGTVRPSDGVDYTPAQGTKIFGMDTWNGLQTLADAQISKKTTVTAFKPTVDGTYYFVLKLGSNNTAPKEILLDEISLSEKLQVKADFYADVVSGNAPLSVKFYDLSTNATSWAWDFGDGGTSTLRDPVFVYTKGGKYTVKLTASNSSSTDVLTSANMITVVGATVTAPHLTDGYSVSVINNTIKVDKVQYSVEIIDLSGRLFQSIKVNGQFSSKPLNTGIYILRVDGNSSKISIY